jgi:hypothetical protein
VGGEQGVRDLNRRRVAKAKSHKASPAELREAKVRLKEIEEELRAVPLAPETKRGEDRERRYTRILRLRALREDFEQRFPYDKRPHANSLLLSLVMFVSSFAVCACMVGSVVGGYNLLTAKPDPTGTGGVFWDGVTSQDYASVHDSYLSPTLRVQQKTDTFVLTARQTDSDYGIVTNAVFIKKQVNSSGDTAALTYTVTRGTATTYPVTLTLTLFNGTWGISDLGATFQPTQAGVPAASPTPTPSPTATPAN